MLHSAAMRLAEAVLPNVICRVRRVKNEVFLTFDDGPHPEATPWVLDRLAEHGAKATFFCLGEQAVAYPELLARIKREGHAIGHHTWDHPDGWKTGNRAYLENVVRGQKAVGGHMFRPPYGRIGPVQAGKLSNAYRIVLWDVLAGDFRQGATGVEVADAVLERSKAGSIVVFHDNRKSFACLREALPLVLEGLTQKGSRLAALDTDL